MIRKEAKLIERRSKKRDAIYRELCSTETHPTAEWIYAQLKQEMPDLSLGTVYSNLSAFKRNGMAVCVGVVDGKERFDGHTDSHAHFICRTCGAVMDLSDVPLPDKPRLKGKVESCQLNYFGLCAKCESRENQSN